ncbi:hypothetical protein [Pedobacter sp. B4-66]|uniref:hypothetical protein n=1 Tax=Pedobacter sp. B4-66 TaxID=2817280 RepID=UPI001BDB51AA|nr:hypothetical protein [Pedobacter sp. B4-66]
MKFALFSLLSLSVLTLSCSSQTSKPYPFKLEIHKFKIGDQVDTSEFKKIENVYFPNHLDGWEMDNIDQLPEKYKNLPIAIWGSTTDSTVILTLLKNTVLNIVLSGISQSEKDSLSKVFTDKSGIKNRVKTYEQSHPLQSYITYWNLETWDTGDVILELGNSEMRLPKDPASKKRSWNMVYSDFVLEKSIINNFKKTNE